MMIALREVISVLLGKLILLEILLNSRDFIEDL